MLCLGYARSRAPVRLARRRESLFPSLLLVALSTGFPRAPLGRFRGRLVEREHRVYEVHVGSDGLLRELLGGLLAPPCMLGQLLGSCLHLLGGPLEVVDHGVEELLGKLGV